MNETARDPVENRMTKVQTALGWSYLPVHMFVLPVLLSLYTAVSPEYVSTGTANLIYHGVSFVFILCVMFSYLRREFDSLLDRPGRCLMAVLGGIAINYALSFSVGLLTLLLLEPGENPNNAAVAGAMRESYGVLKALGLYIGPITEETLFRGVAFGTLRPRSRALAYAASTLLFAVYHVWQFALFGVDARFLLYLLQYVPMSLALDWCYDRSGSVWACIFFHMGYNAVMFSVIT